MRVFIKLSVLASLAVAGAAHAVTLEFPDLGLSSSPDDVRAWLKEHEFTAMTPEEPDQEAYQHEFPDGQRETVSFVAGENGLKMLRFDQAGVLELAPTLRKKLYDNIGKPDKDQILPGGTLRLIYPYEYSEPARRMFLIQPHYLSMIIMTEAYVDRVNSAAAEEERVEQETKQAAKREARRAWLVPMLWVTGIGLGLAAFIRFMPSAVSDPVSKVVRSGLEAAFGITGEVVTRLFYIATGLVLFGTLILSGLAVGSGALEWGTSWWWAVPWVFGAMLMLKADDEDNIGWAWVAIVFFAIALFGVMFQGTWSSG